ncbi:MAG: hypothetical protein NVSMB68_09890 [Thermoanaerobaculia bacterium]
MFLGECGSGTDDKGKHEMKRESHESSVRGAAYRDRAESEIQRECRLTPYSGTDGRLRVMRIKEVADASGVGVETVRFYERKGLIEQPSRRSGSYRNYDDNVAARIRFVRLAQALGFTLVEVKELLSLRVDPRTSCADVKGRAEAKIADIDGKIASLRKMRGALLDITRTCSGAGPTSECPILDFMAGNRAEKSQR